mmetsp:Transcript_21171/g.25479  ORF Transcript_21171/g.25479 Transcript_21171/m.25479 type:complete len:189 (+) Transcript_21171:324-890(+)|eukprot:CAMPEP_0197851564 /NCGR_PEP_ID=MMETSP1438-20131217/18340_1 /TAXON_ID=1461541 /ORGANISM="Pterosperma sp., Strain CCMP1384" /LENGTH=188 /DNA_ID=CAMNT_0043465199 /DNA_START=306 /DNA_END=872 /DNA_ORIENTATION=+
MGKNEGDAAYDYIWGEQTQASAPSGPNAVSVDALWRKRVKDEHLAAKRWPDEYNQLLQKSRALAAVPTTETKVGSGDPDAEDALSTFAKGAISARKKRVDFQAELQKAYLKDKAEEEAKAMQSWEDREGEAMDKFMHNFFRKKKVTMPGCPPLAQNGKQMKTSQDYGWKGNAAKGNLEKFGRLTLHLR